MIRVLDASIRDIDAASVTVHFILQDDSGAGIRQVDVLDRDRRVRIHSEDGGCAAFLEFDVRVSPSALPLWVRSEDCAGRITDPDVTGPLLVPPPRAVGPPMCGDDPLLCLAQSADCVEAVAALERARGALAPRCGECEYLRRQQAHWEARLLALSIAILVMMAAFAAAMLAGGLFGIIVGVFIFAILVFLGVQWAEAGHLARDFRERAERCEREVAELRSQFASAVTRVGRHCCPECLLVSTDAPC